MNLWSAVSLETSQLTNLVTYNSLDWVVFPCLRPNDWETNWWSCCSFCPIGWSIAETALARRKPRPQLRSTGSAKTECRVLGMGAVIGRSCLSTASRRLPANHWPTRWLRLTTRWPNSSWVDRNTNWHLIGKDELNWLLWFSDECQRWRSLTCQ